MSLSTLTRYIRPQGCVRVQMYREILSTASTNISCPFLPCDPNAPGNGNILLHTIPITRTRTRGDAWAVALASGLPEDHMIIAFMLCPVALKHLQSIGKCRNVAPWQRISLGGQHGRMQNLKAECFCYYTEQQRRSMLMSQQQAFIYTRALRNLDDVWATHYAKLNIGVESAPPDFTAKKGRRPLLARLNPPEYGYLQVSLDGANQFKEEYLTIAQKQEQDREAAQEALSASLWTPEVPQPDAVWAAQIAASIEACSSE
jgi:hypothetical protein